MAPTRLRHLSMVAFAVLVVLPAVRAQQDASLTDQPLAASRRELLQLAFAAVSAMPSNPHAKNRSRAQADVVAACIELDQCKLAQELSARIDDWRRGLCLADLAIHCIENGAPAVAEPLLAQAQRVAIDTATDPQQWRAERIRARLARAHLLLGHGDQAKEQAAGIGDAELGEVARGGAQRLPRSEFEATVVAFDRVIAAGNFEQIRNTLATCVALFDRFYTDEPARAQMETRVLSAYDKLPVGLRLELVVQLVDVALQRGDPRTALRLAAEAERFLTRVVWSPEDEIAWRGRLAGLRGRAGDTVAGRTAAEQALARFHECRERIVDIFRAEALQPVAVAFLQVGDLVAAGRVFRLAVEEGAHNPNSRPRAEDLAATCVVMAVHAFEPEPALRDRLEQLRKGLGNPW